MRLLMISLLALVPCAAADGLDLGLAKVLVHNGHESRCDNAVGICVVTLRGDSPADWTIDTEQRVSYAGVAANRSYVNERLGFDLLPDGSLVIDTSLFLDAPVMMILTQTVGSPRAPPPADDFGLVLTPTRYGFDYVGPRLDNPRSDVEPRSWSLSYTNKSIVQYDGFHMDAQFHNYSTDEFLVDNTMVNCRPDLEPACSALFPGGVEAARERAPNVVYGISLVEAELATDPRHLGNAPGSLGERSAPMAPLGFRTPVPAFEPGPVASGGGVGLAGPVPGPEAMGNPPAGGPRDPPSEARVAPPTRAPSPESSPPAAPVVLAVAGGLTMGWLAALLYSRIRRDEALRHGHRARLLAILAERGPQALVSLARELAIDRTTVEHHARLLVRTGHLVVARVGGRVVFTLPGQEAGALVLRKGSRAEEAILGVLRSHAGALPRRVLANLLGDVPRRSRSEAMLRLQERGVIRREWEGRVEMVRLAPAA